MNLERALRWLGFGALFVLSAVFFVWVVTNPDSPIVLLVFLVGTVIQVIYWIVRKSEER